jgi:O-methyltransferase
MRLLRHLHDGVRNVLGEKLYWRVANVALEINLMRKLALREFEARDVGPKGLDVLRLNERDRLEVLTLGVHYTYASFVEGDVAEFGTASGITARGIARAMIAAERDRPTKRLYLFDSFAGHPEATADTDSFEIKNRVWKAGFPRLLSKTELVESCGRILPVERIRAFEGWFKDTLAEMQPLTKFAFVHFHGDLYQSAMDAIGGLFNRGAIAEGALICFSGFNTGRANPHHNERRAWGEIVSLHKVEFSPWRSYGAQGQAFIVHSYAAARAVTE